MTDSSLLDRVLQPGALTTMMQPIFEVTPSHKRLFALECLTRGPKGSSLERADILFEFVRRKGEEPLVDRVCIVSALAAAGTIDPTVKITFNVHASTLGRDRGFVSFILEESAKQSVSPSRLVVEIIEHTPYSDGQMFARAIEDLRSAGIAVAIDDFGIGLSNLRMFLEAKPSYLKLDRYFIDGAANDPDRRAIIQSVVELSNRFKTQVVAEGVEEEDDLAAVLVLGVSLIQGWVYAPALTVEQARALPLMEPMTDPHVTIVPRNDYLH